jgi:uncharacterized membrane protein
MIVLNFIVGLLPFVIIYGLGKWQTKEEKDTELGEVFARGFITLALCGVVFAVLILVYMLGKFIVDSLI